MTQIVDGLADVDDESLIEPGTMVVTLTRDGYVKRTPLDTFRAQGRGGKGRTGAGTREDDVVIRSFVAHTHQYVLFFTSRGMAFREKVWWRDRARALAAPGPRAAGRGERHGGAAAAARRGAVGGAAPGLRDGAGQCAA
jgi:DNA gyrase subunit A